MRWGTPCFSSTLFDLNHSVGLVKVGAFIRLWQPVEPTSASPRLIEATTRRSQRRFSERCLQENFFMMFDPSSQGAGRVITGRG
jgi:hypothetical protein